MILCIQGYYNDVDKCQIEVKQDMVGISNLPLGGNINDNLLSQCIRVFVYVQVYVCNILA